MTEISFVKASGALLVAESPWHKNIDSEYPNNSTAYKNVYYRTSEGKYLCIQYTNKVRNHTKFFGIVSTGDGDIEGEKYRPTITFMDEEDFLKSAINEGALRTRDIIDGAYAG